MTKAATEVFESSARAMKEGRSPQWRFSNDRTAELQGLIEATEKMEKMEKMEMSGLDFYAHVATRGDVLGRAACREGR
ncbi:hypothetical protein [Streptomyces azureus]|uniref:Uncharacterized protein n=1 Tax=Streptomyces azureus TaxID=146537 RepID=A0A0K8PWU3_STRAJ|nr:hypothetical protein [Streptomyces azureus]GAP52213.1 uncharacterized protein SAZU_7087 [Streptomyces azureus]